MSDFTEWLNQNSGRAYPLAENSARTDVTGSFKIPNEIIVGASIAITAEYVDGTFYISRMTILPGTASLVIGYSDDTSTRDVATITVPASHKDYDAYAFTGSGDDSAITGTIIIGSLESARRLFLGVLNFLPQSTPFEVNVFSASISAVKRIEIIDGARAVASFTDVLRLRAGSNVRLTYEDDHETIRLDVVPSVSSSALVEGDCENVDFAQLPPPIRTINGKAAVNGNFSVEGGDCISIQSSTGQIIVSDSCASPCCGCAELDTLTSAMTQLESQIQSINSLASSLSESQSKMIAELVSKTLRDVSVTVTNLQEQP